MNDAKAKAYTWCAEVIHDEWADTKPDAGDGDAIDAEIVLIMEALFAAAENRAAAPKVPPADLTMVAPGYGPVRRLITAADLARVIGAPEEATPKPSPPVNWKRDGLPQRPSPPAIVALPEVPAPPCPRCGKHVAAADMAEHPCGLPR